VQIPLKSGSDTLAVLKPRFAAKSADLIIQHEVFRLRVRMNGYRCHIYKNEVEVARARGLGQIEGAIKFADGKTYRLKRTGTRGNRLYTWENGALRIDNGLLTTDSGREVTSMLTQAALVFSYLQKQYEKENQPNTQFIPIVVGR
jgi:hypothetical protein